MKSLGHRNSDRVVECTWKHCGVVQVAAVEEVLAEMLALTEPPAPILNEKMEDAFEFGKQNVGRRAGRSGLYL